MLSNIDPTLFVVLIFLLRISDYAVGTVRTIAVARDLRLLSALLGLIGPFIFITATSQVLTNLGNVANLLAYCLGGSVGTYIGMVIEARFVTGYVICRIIPLEDGHTIAEALRALGHGVTELHATDEHRGDMRTLTSVINRRDLPELLATVHRLDTRAFVTVRSARSVKRGWLRALRNQK